MGLADTGRPHREPEVVEEQAVGGHRSWPAGCFAESAKRWEEKMKTTHTSPAVTTAPKNWVNWEKMEIARTPQGRRWHGTA